MVTPWGGTRSLANLIDRMMIASTGNVALKMAFVYQKGLELSGSDGGCVLVPVLSKLSVPKCRLGE